MSSCLIAVLFLLLSPSLAAADSSTISLNPSVSNNSVINYKSSVTFSGLISPPHPSTTVIIQSKRAGNNVFKELGRTTTNSSGNYTFEFNPQASGYYKASWNGDGDYNAATSSSIYISVKAQVALGKFSKPKWAGQIFYVTGKVLPSHSKKLVSVQVNKRGWKTIAKGRTDRRGNFKVKTSIKNTGKFRLRAAFSDIDHTLGSSNGFNVKLIWANPWKISAKYRHYIVVSKKSFYLWYLRNGRIVKKFRTGVGQPAYPTPSGNFRVVRKAVRPTWYRPSSSWAANMPASIPWPSSPLGERGLYTSASGIIIHGTTQPWLLDRPYRAVSHGCIRLKNPWVIWLYNRAPVGTRVKIYG